MIGDLVLLGVATRLVFDAVNEGIHGQWNPPAAAGTRAGVRVRSGNP